VALAIGLHHPAFSIYPMAGGELLATVQADHITIGPGLMSFVPTPAGYHALLGTGIESVADRGTFTAYDARGAVLSRGADLEGQPRLVRLDPVGGTALLTLSGPLFAPNYQLELVSPEGVRRAAVALDREVVDIAVATDGHVLARGASAARWFDHDLAPITEWFPFAFHGSPISVFRTQLAPLADGSIALREDATWTTLFANGVAATAPAPGWLADRPGTEVFLVRGGKANAVVAMPDQATCGGGSAFELVTPAGASCGSVTLPPGAGCSQVAFGRDGTAMVLSVDLPSEGSPPVLRRQRCTWRWWPGLLR
jgi:hypothetical protein